MVTVMEKSVQIRIPIKKFAPNAAKRERVTAFNKGTDPISGIFFLNIQAIKIIGKNNAIRLEMMLINEEANTKTPY